MQIPGRLRKQTFTLPAANLTVRVTTTANGALATAFDNASPIDGVTLATGDLILVKNQTTATENGVYTVQASGAPVRHPSYDTAGKLSVGFAAIYVTEGTVYGNTTWFQKNALLTLSDNQSWSRTPYDQYFTVPPRVTTMFYEGCGGGGSGGGGATQLTGSGGGGGGGGPIAEGTITTVPGDRLAIVIGEGGLGPATDTIGASGTSSTIIGTGVSITLVGGGGGGLGGQDTANGGAGIATIYSEAGAGGVGNANSGGGGGGGASTSTGGDGGAQASAPKSGSNGGGGGGGNGRNTSRAGATGGGSVRYPIRSTGGTASSSGGGGGGGASFGAGGNGGNGAATPTNGADAANDSGGGGGGGGGSADTGAGARGGNGGSGLVTLIWVE